MLIIVYIISVLLLVSVGFNIFLIAIRNKPVKQVSYDVKALLQDLMGGAGLVRVERVAPENVFLKSPKDM